MSRDPDHLHPALRELWEALVPAAKKELGLDIFLTCTYRSHAEQARLYAQGRTSPGPVVTNARPGQSAHNVAPPEGSHALDFAVSDGRGGVTWEAGHYRAVARIAQRLGADCGAFWPGFPDNPHIQMPDWAQGKRYGLEYRFVRGVPTPAAVPRVFLRDQGGTNTVWDGKPTVYGGQAVSAAWIAQMALVYPPGRVATLGGVRLERYPDGAIQLDRVKLTPKSIPATPLK